MKRFFLALLIGLLIASLAAPGVLSAEPDQAVTNAVTWLRGQQQADGGFLGFGGASDGSMTAEAALAFAAAGIDPGLVALEGQSVVDFLRRAAPDYGSTTGGAAKLTLAAVAAGLDPTDFGGVDLVARIRAAYDPDTDLYDSQLFVDAYAILALAAAGESIPEDAVNALVDRQADNGGWAFSGSTDASQADSNTTAIAIQALAAAGARSSVAVDRALGYLRAVQTDSGAFAYDANSSDRVGDANSTALAIQALVAVGEDPESDSWGNALEALRAFQNSSGAFRYRDDAPDDNLLATAQAIPALMLEGLPIQPHPGFGRASALDRARQPVAPKEGCVFYPETGHNLCAGFRSYWLEFGGLAIYGYPITEEFVEDGLTVQYFERARFEWHPGVSPSHYDVLLGLLGNEVTEKRAAEGPFQPTEPRQESGCIFFPQTGHNLCSGFAAYWERYGGLSTYGYPISEEFVEDGMTVQYFERARFEWHPGVSPSHYDVLLTRIGASVLEADK